MKIAVCLSGHLRKFELTFPTLYLHLLKNHDCDIFLHTWDKMGYACNYKTDQTQQMTSLYLPRIEKTFQPKKMIIESSSFIEDLKRQGDEYAPHLRNEPKHVGHMASMFYKIYAANELRKRHELETGVQYDWIVRCRPDLTFNQVVNMPAQKKPKTVYLAKSQSMPGWFNDQFAIASPTDMDLYSSFFFHMPEYFKARNEFYPEKFMDWSLKKKGLTPELWDLHFNILR